MTIFWIIFGIILQVESVNIAINIAIDLKDDGFSVGIPILIVLGTIAFSYGRNLTTRGLTR